MKNRVNICFTVVCLLMLAASADAQRTRRTRGNTTPPAGNQQGTQQQQTTNNAAPPSGFNPYGNIPIRVETNAEDTVKMRPSLRQDNAFDKSAINERTPLPYEHLRWDDALFAEKVWRELDLREKMNMPFRYKAEDDNGDQRFVMILLRAVENGEVMAFQDDRFSIPMDSAARASITASGTPDTTARTDVNDPSKIIEYVVTTQSFNADEVTKIRVKEEWVFDREASRMFVRILGIAPLKTSYMPNGEERGNTVMFWVYYPDLRPILARYEVYNPKNMGNGRMTWEELFESRMFSSYITKSTLDNASNRTIKQLIKDPILGLLEGENIKDKIFNYEQDLWSY